MSGPDAGGIGATSQPPFAVPPDPATVFARRGRRLAALAEGHDLGDYLRFIARLCDTQAAVLPDLPAGTPPAEADLDRAVQAGMPPIDRRDLLDDPVLGATADRFLAACTALPMPPEAAAALARLRADPALLRQCLADALDDAAGAETVAEHVFAAAVVQVHATRLAAALPADRLAPIADGVCPACGGALVAAVVVDRPNAHGVRFCVCATCATEWHVVRVKCTLCGGTKGIAYQHVEGHADGVQAETCESCRGYVKIVALADDPARDALADDVASLGLDLLLREAGWHRGGVNPFLAGA